MRKSFDFIDLINVAKNLSHKNKNEKNSYAHNLWLIIDVPCTSPAWVKHPNGMKFTISKQHAIHNWCQLFFNHSPTRSITEYINSNVFEDWKRVQNGETKRLGAEVETLPDGMEIISRGFQIPNCTVKLF